MNRKEELQVIKERVKIVDLIRHTGLQSWPSGPHRLKIRSLINVTEHKPSLVIYLDQNTFYDYSSAQGGSVIDFYQLLYGVDYIKAVKDLRALAGLNGSIKTLKKKPQDVLRAREAFNTILSLCFLLPSKIRHERLQELASMLEAFQDDLQCQINTTDKEEG